MIEQYKDVFIEIAEDGRWYEVYEITPIFKQKAVFMTGACVHENTFTLQSIAQKVDQALQCVKE